MGQIVCNCDMSLKLFQVKGQPRIISHNIPKQLHRERLNNKIVMIKANSSFALKGQKTEDSK